jgi:hypothetical protein
MGDYHIQAMVELGTYAEIPNVFVWTAPNSRCFAVKYGKVATKW